MSIFGRTVFLGENMKEIYKVTLAHARCNENGKATGGKPGDQTANKEHTKGELRFEDWYLSGNGWDFVLRPTTDSIKQLMPEDACRAVRNTHIGYGQNDRYTLYDTSKSVAYDCAKVEKNVDCDCSSLMTVCANYAGVAIPRETSTHNMKVRYSATGMFKILSANKYTKKPDYLKKGDILVRTGYHTAIVANTLYHMTRELMLVEGSHMKGDDVRALQQRLNEIADGRLETDGIFGPRTEDQLIMFQATHDLLPDGIMGRKTAEAMGFLWD